jgi:hypothetical protein
MTLVNRINILVKRHCNYYLQSYHIIYKAQTLGTQSSNFRNTKLKKKKQSNTNLPIQTCDTAIHKDQQGERGQQAK